MQDLGAIDELELGKRHNAVLVERGLEGEVEAGKGLNGGEPCHDKRGLDAPALAQGELLGEQDVDGLERCYFAALESAHRRIKGLDSTWHFEPDHCLLDTIDHGRNDLNMGGHCAPPWPASRRPTAW